jgi:subtilase family serine protease
LFPRLALLKRPLHAGLALLALCMGVPALHAQKAIPRLLPDTIDENKLTTLTGGVPLQARAEYDQGAVQSALPMNRMILVLKRSDTQEKALQAAIQAMHDPKSPQFHKWLTPAQFGQQYGSADEDVATVVAWLKGHGFQVNSVAQGRGSIEFSGTADAVASTFHTQIHSYTVKGTQHYANATNPKIPTALTPVVSGVLSLHNFTKQSSARILGKGQFNTGTPAKSANANAAAAKSSLSYTPNFTSSGTNYVGPGDLWTIYNATPLITASQANVDGTGQTIAIVGRSDVTASDIKGFRSFLLPAPYSTTYPFTQILNGPDPGLNDDQVEQTLDVEYASAMAPGAQIDLVVSGSTNTTDGVDLSALYIVDNNLAPVMSASYGMCEAGLGSGNAFYNALWEQAAAQGITPLVSSGDNGAAGCDAVGPSGMDNMAYVSDEGLQVNGLSSTPYNVSVGGSEFSNDTSAYWNTINNTSPAPFTSALSYVPEQVWNESCSPLVCGNEGAEIAAGSGGASGCFNPTFGSDGNISSCSGGYAMPDWQSGVKGIPTDGKRHMPDISLTSSGHDGYMVCIYGSCANSSFYAVGGTSAASPSFAGIMALVNQKTGARQGQANYTLYRLAGSQYGTTGSPNTSQLTSCNASNGNASGTSCIFHDVTAGSNEVPCDGGTLNCNSTVAGVFGVLTDYVAEPGYDSATGLGSVNVTNLVNHWNDVTPAATATTLSLGATTSTFGTPVNIAVTVTPATGTGTPTGNVALLTDSTISEAVGAGTVTLTNGSYNSTISTLPGGSYNVSARYAGDSSFATSTSTSSNITVAPAASSVGLTIAGYDPITLTAVTGTTLPYGSIVTGTVALVGVSGQIVPSGTVALSSGGTKLADVVSAADGTLSYSATGYTLGTYSWTASYAGNSNYNASTSSPASFAVGQAATTLKLVANTSYVVGSNTGTLTAIVTDDSLLANPTGSIAFSVNGKVAGTVAVAAYTDLSTKASEAKATFTVDSSMLTAGVNTITAAFSGDANYIASISPSLSLGYGTTTATNTIALAVSPAVPQLDQPVTLAATVTTGGIPATAGTVQFYDGANLIGTAQVAGSIAASGHTTGTATFAMLPGPGNHTFTAKYLGILAAPAAVVSAPVSSTVSGSLFASLTIAGAPNTSNSANYDLTGTVTGHGFAIPSATIDFAETSVIADLGSVSVDASTAAHTLTTPANITNGDSTAPPPSQALLVDLNGDGILDMATSNASFTGGSMSVLIGNGDGTFKTPTTYATNAKFTFAITSGDFNNDGVLDLAVTSQYDSKFNQGFVLIFLGNGDGTFKQASTVNMTGYPVSTAVADYNRDGILDIAALQFIPGQISVSFGNGDGTFQKQVNYAVTAGLGSEYNLVAGDFNGDGIPDLVESNASDDNLGIFLNNGDGSFGTQIPVNTLNPEWITVADLNSDGKQDLLISNYGYKTIGVLLGNGDSTFQTEVDYPTNGNAASLALADMDGDGKLDIAAGIFYPKIGVGILKGNGDGTFGAETDYATNQGHGYGISLGDLNGDGTPDLLSSDINSGDTASQRLAVLLNITQAKAILSDVAIAGPASIAQQVQGVYSGDTNYVASSSASINVNGSGIQAKPQIIWTPASPWGAGVALGTNVLNAAIDGNIAGTFTYTTQLQGGSVAQVTAASTLTAGTYTVTATFVPVNSTNYSTISATRTVIVQAADFAITTDTTSLTITAGGSGTATVSLPALYGFTGTVTLSGASLPGGFTVTASPASITAGGSSTITVKTTGLSTTSASAAPVVSLGQAGLLAACLLAVPFAWRRRKIFVPMIVIAFIVAGSMTGCGGTSFGASSVSLASASTKVASGGTVVLTATVSSKNSHLSGTVGFYNGTTQLGTATLSNGTAALSLTSLPVGLNSLTAVYSGDEHNSSATSTALSELITGKTSIEIVATSGSVAHSVVLPVTLQ